MATRVLMGGPELEFLGDKLRAVVDKAAAKWFNRHQ